MMYLWLTREEHKEIRIYEFSDNFWIYWDVASYNTYFICLKREMNNRRNDAQIYFLY